MDTVRSLLSLLNNRPEASGARQRAYLKIMAVVSLVSVGLAVLPLLPLLWELLPDRSQALLGQVPTPTVVAVIIAPAPLVLTALLVVGHRKVLPTGLGWRILGAWALAVLFIAIFVAAMWLVLGVPGLDTAPTVSPKVLDAIATRAFAIVAGLGGVALLVIAYQRQSGESTRLFTERFTTAVAQLGEEQPAVRLGGVHALAHLADDAPTPGLRQMCVDVLCAYLRNPGPEDLPEARTDDQRQAHHDRVVEHAATREVRLTIVRIISQRLRTTTPWRDCNYDFTGVIFERALKLSGAMCHGRMDFSGSSFTGGADFEGATLTDANFDGASFADVAVFKDVGFDVAEFEGVSFGGIVDFELATFVDEVRFDGSSFTDDAKFDGVTFNGATFFRGAIFADSAYYENVYFVEDADFEGTTFIRVADFRGATFDGSSHFQGVTFPKDADFLNATFNSLADFRGETADHAATGPCPQGLLAIAESSHGMVQLPQSWTRNGYAENPPPSLKPNTADG